MKTSLEGAGVVRKKGKKSGRILRLRTATLWPQVIYYMVQLVAVSPGPSFRCCFLGESHTYARFAAQHDADRHAGAVRLVLARLALLVQSGHKPRRHPDPNLPRGRRRKDARLTQPQPPQPPLTRQGLINILCACADATLRRALPSRCAPRPTPLSCPPTLCLFLPPSAALPELRLSTPRLLWPRPLRPCDVPHRPVRMYRDHPGLPSQADLCLPCQLGHRCHGAANRRCHRAGDHWVRPRHR